jgi:hypothetical protein
LRPIGCPETSVGSYQPTLRNITEEQRSYLYFLFFDSEFSCICFFLFFSFFPLSDLLNLIFLDLFRPLSKPFLPLPQGYPALFPGPHVARQFALCSRV